MTPVILTSTLLALLGAFLFGIQAIFGRKGLNYMDPQTGVLITIGTSTLVFWALAPFMMEWSHWRSPAIWVFLSSGLIHPTVSMWLFFEANKRMGPTISGTVSSTTPLFATAGAVLALGEGLSVGILIGTLTIVVGITVLSWQRSGLMAWSLAALGFPLGAALVRATIFVWSKFGLSILDDPYLAATASFTVSFLLCASVFGLGKSQRARDIPPRGYLWCILGGVCVSGAILGLYFALSLGQVVIVAPLINTYPMFTLILVLAFRQERIGLRTASGVLLVVGGVALINLF